MKLYPLSHPRFGNIR